eukprot:NODE_1866_length_710_cov_80.025729_g1816_i0.p1 GENE.NODE_1866_length_710_cov_80.025729_g1816_i0~~NODE_1866_length_710_cov_80.025729_g1816_i0.p1  ORF type:complete len:203 (+),score=33.54 NODE_1866_length_710_cov_80.025729_g1816_i0:75-683(+)
MSDDQNAKLCSAAEMGKLAKVKELLAAGANPNWKNPSNSEDTAVHRAAFLGHTECVKVLLESKGDPNVPNKHGVTPLHKAAHRDQLEVVKLLIGAGADVKARTLAQSTPLHDAARGGSKAIVKLLLDKGADPRAKDFQNRFPRDMTQWNEIKYMLAIDEKEEDRAKSRAAHGFSVDASVFEDDNDVDDSALSAIGTAFEGYN